MRGEMRRGGRNGFGILLLLDLWLLSLVRWMVMMRHRRLAMRMYWMRRMREDVHVSIGTGIVVAIPLSLHRLLRLSCKALLLRVMRSRSEWRRSSGMMMVLRL